MVDVAAEAEVASCRISVVLISVSTTIGRMAEPVVDPAGHVQPTLLALHVGDRTEAYQCFCVVALAVRMRIAGRLGLILDSRLLYRGDRAMLHGSAVTHAVLVA